MKKNRFFLVFKPKKQAMSDLYSPKPRARNPVLPPYVQPEAEDPVVILYRTEDDRMACWASIGGEPDNGYYCIYRGDRQGTIAMVEYVLKALKQGNPAVLLEKPAASLDGLEEQIFKTCARERN
jgi:hypothetical protein